MSLTCRFELNECMRHMIIDISYILLTCTYLFDLYIYILFIIYTLHDV